MQQPDVKAAVERAKASKRRPEPTASAVLPDGSLVEMVYRPEEERTLFAVFKDGQVRYEGQIEAGSGRVLVPYSPRNNLLTNDVVLFPSEATQYGSENELVTAVRAFIHRYVDVSSLFEQVASYYVLFSWVYDAFNELPYLRLRGDTGSGKTRFLLTVGALCYKPIFASGASTVSPLFRILNAMRGTLIIDEGDFRFSDEKAEVVKILNNGNARGFPVLRSESVGQREFSPRAYQVFGPKLVATRGYFQDRALESRCLTEEMGARRLRQDVPINLTDKYRREALGLRNKLLMFRFLNWHTRRIDTAQVDRSIEPRLAQVFTPLLSVVEDQRAREAVFQLARDYNRQLVADRGTQVEAQVLEAIQELRAEGHELAVKDITARFIALHGENYDRKITPHWIGHVVRRKLGLRTERHREGYAIATSEKPRLEYLCERYGIGALELPLPGPADSPAMKPRLG